MYQSWLKTEINFTVHIHANLCFNTTTPPPFTKIKDLLTQSTKNILFKIMFLSIIHCKRELLLTTWQSIFLFPFLICTTSLVQSWKPFKNEPFLTACRNSVYTWFGILIQVLETSAFTPQSLICSWRPTSNHWFQVPLDKYMKKQLSLLCNVYLHLVFLNT